MSTYQNALTLPLIEKTLTGLPLGEVRFYPSTASTNTDALDWSARGAPDFSIVLADAQTQGRGRITRSWFTPAGSALACSIIFRPRVSELPNIALFTVLGTLAVCHLAEQFCNTPAHIKWPNDVLIEGKKTAGILAETVWEADQPTALVLGLGVNLLPASVPDSNTLLFPATCLQEHALQPIDRLQALRFLVEGLLKYRPLVSDKPTLLHAWRSRLAYLGQEITISGAEKSVAQGTLLGLDDDGAILVRSIDGTVHTCEAGDLSLRLAESSE